MASGFDFVKIEEKILKFWKDRDIFQRSLAKGKRGKRFVFFEGPPTANGRPGIHHFLGRAYKDLFVRYKSMYGFYVPRRAGWDTHGLPVEIEVEKELSLKSKKEIEEYGIAKFNKKAKENVWKYKEEWERFTERIGFWLDMANPYVTYDWHYIESLWTIIKEIDKKKLFYEGHKVLPWCPRCGTALSSHEVAQGYQDVTETSVYVKFQVKSENLKIKNRAITEKTYILAWTTTPWTLPGNVALAVGKKIKYVVVEKNGEQLIVAKELLEKVVGDSQVMQELDGSDLIGLEYEPLFDIAVLKTEKAYKIYPADFVTTEDGTGVVHTAVMYGEDDYELGSKLGLPKHHTVDPDGRFNKEVKEFEGRNVKEAEPDIIKYLSARGSLFRAEAYTHSYPFCWRCKTALIYYARNSWFVAMSKLRKQLLRNNKKVNWLPAHIKNGRFGEFLKEAKDWAFSRERYWGTPLPVWCCNKCQELLTAGSLEDLEKYRYRPKNTYFIMRHGFSERGDDTNEFIISSRLEHDKYQLTAKGHEQIKEVADNFARQGGVDLIFSSPFLRTKQSAQILADKFGLRVHIDERLKELDHGSMCEGQSHPVCVAEHVQNNFDVKYGDGESWRDVKRRMFDFIKEIDDKYEGKRIMVVSHGDPLWILRGIIMGLSEKEMITRRDEIYLWPGGYKGIEVGNYPYDEEGDLDLHRPYVDEILLKCSKCGDKMHRVKEVVDVWFDSGSMPYAQWHYPFENGAEFKRAFPADFIAEGIDQTRGWFYTLLAVSTLLSRGNPYKNVISHGHVLDEKGKKMSKSIGNVVDPWEVIDQFGVDAVRWYFYTVNDAGDSKLFAMNDVRKKMTGFMTTLSNTLRFYELYGGKGGQGKAGKVRSEHVLDRWALSRLGNLVQVVRKSLDDYDATGASRAIEQFVVEDFSNWWIRRSRERFQKPANADDLKDALNLLRYILTELAKLLAPFTPFMAEHIYKKVSNRKESVHLEDWPKPHKKHLDLDLEKTMVELRELVTLGLAWRKEKGIKVRQPLASATVKRADKFDTGLERLLTDELNIKKVNYDPAAGEILVIDEHLTAELVLEGYAREIMRQIQDMRKEAGYKFDDKVYSAWESSNKDVIDTIGRFGKEIAEDTLLKQFEKGRPAEMAFDISKEFELAPQVGVWLGIRSKK